MGGDRSRKAGRTYGGAVVRVVLVAGLLIGCSRNDPADGADSNPTGTLEAVLSVPFNDVTDDVGLSFTHDPGVAGGYRMAEIMGPGCALADFDGDGRLDVYLVNGQRRLAQDGTPATRDRLYRQADDGTFVDVTERSGIEPVGYGMGCAVGDYDNDGDLDLYLCNFDRDRLWRNNGDGTFADVTESAGIDNPLWSVTASFLDYDRDGLLDLFVVNYVLDPDAARCYDLAGRPDYCGPANLQPAPDRLYHNDGQGRFRDVSVESGIAALAGPGLGIICTDLNDDGWPDAYVANDMSRNFLWLNRADPDAPGFEEAAVAAGCAFNGDGRVEAGMGIALGDVDQDGLLDLFITHLRGETNTLYRRIGPESFIDVTDLAGLGLSSTAATGFGTGLIDFDHDGDLDLLIVNGAVKRLSWRSAGAATDDFWADYAEPNFLYRNDGAGRFTDISAAAGALCGSVEVSRGLAIGDIDGDGDLDVLISQDGGRARLLRNDAAKSGRWLIVRAVEPDLRRDALGAVVTVLAGGRTHKRVILSTVSYASNSQAVAHFGLGEVDRIDQVAVTWPDGETEQFTDVPIDATVELRRGGRVVEPQ